MIRCIAVDDEAYAAEIIADFINKTPGLVLAGSTTDPFAALKLIEDAQIDLVFLDIQMPELTGIQFLKICGDKCKVILTTAYEEYAVRGFDLDVVDYLLKPIPYERFYKSVLKAKKLIAQSPVVQPVAGANEYIFVKGDTKNKFTKVDLKEIAYIEGLKNYVSVYTATQRLITYQTLREFEAQLPASEFIRIHKSYIIPFSQIVSIDGNTVYLKNHDLRIGDTYKEAFFKAIKERK